MGKLIVGLARMLPLGALILLLPALAASQPALTAGLYTGLTSQVSGCNNTVHPITSCDTRFNIASTLDQLSPSPQVATGLGSNPCPGALKYVFAARCGTVVIIDYGCPAMGSVPITNGHWQVNLVFGPGVFTTITADCAGVTCQGTYNTTNSTGSCVTGLLTWSAQATGSATASVVARTSEGDTAEEDTVLEGVKIEVDHHGATFIRGVPDELK
jgi:hypothetical protein